MSPGARQDATAAPRHRFGAHLSIAGGMHHAIEAALRYRMDTVQVFVKNQRQWRASPLKPDNLERWHTLRATPGFGPPFAHATYLINLATADPALYRKSVAAFVEELTRCDTLGIPCLVIHPGSAGCGTIESGIQRIAAALNDIFDRQPTIRAMPLLETTAGQGASIGRTFAELGEIIRLVQEPQRIGVCVNTCHIFAAGYDIRTPAVYSAMVAEAVRHVGLERIRCWHLNDSKCDLGACVDRHTHIGHGCIGIAGFRQLLADRRFVGVPLILETPKEKDAAGRDWDVINLRRLRRIEAALSRSPRRR